MSEVEVCSVPMGKYFDRSMGEIVTLTWSLGKRILTHKNHCKEKHYIDLFTHEFTEMTLVELNEGLQRWINVTINEVAAGCTMAHLLTSLHTKSGIWEQTEQGIKFKLATPDMFASFILKQQTPDIATFSSPTNNYFQQLWENDININLDKR